MIELYYEIPIFIMFIFLIYFILQTYKSYSAISSSYLNKAYLWFIGAAICLAIWGIDHIYTDIMPMSLDDQVFKHYYIGHGFLLAVVICLAFGARNINAFSKKFG